MHLNLSWEHAFDREPGEEATLLEASVHYQFKDMVIAAGLGAGLGNDSLDLRLTPGLQQGF